MVTYFQLPQIEYNIRPTNLKIEFEEKKTDKYVFINPSLKRYQEKIKGLIDNHLNDWDNIKKYTNPFEFIHTNIPGQKYSVSKIKPISRAFFKLLEIYNTHHILESNLPIKTFHLAEGPGGFIEATTFLRENLKDTYYGMTLIDEKNSNIPGWKKSDFLMKKYPNINIEYGADNTGNLYNHRNLLYCKNKYKNSMNIVTADGGFDFSVDFNNQEQMALRLILTQVAYAITMQKYNGSFILKMFDTFKEGSINIIYLLSCFYESVIITKPNTSRYANSEKYVVCKHFKFSNTEEIATKFINILKILESIDFNKYIIKSIINIPIQFYYLNNIREINAILGQQQIDNILSTIRIITHKDRKSDKIQHLKLNNIQKCVKWCEKNRINHNKNYQTTNIFLGERGRNNKM